MTGNLAHPHHTKSRSSIATAQWQDPYTVAERHIFRLGDFWLGRTIGDRDVGIGYNDDRHICLCSSSRGGKGTAFIVNNLCLWPGSCVIVDPKGENATVTARRRGAGSDYAEGMGQKVYVLDPFNITDLPDEYRSCFNPLDAIEIDSEESIDEAARLADAIVVSGQSSEPFWDEAARAFIKGIILHIVTSEDYEGRRDLTTLRMLITRGDWESVQLLRDAGEQNIPSAHKMLLAAMRRNEAFGGVIAGIGETYGSMADNSEKTFDSVLQTAITNTEFLDSPGLRKCLSSSDFKLSDLKTDPDGITLYLTLPQRYMNTHFRWLRMMVAMTITEMEKVRRQPASGHRVLLLLDEFANLKRMEIIENAVAQMAGFGVKLVYILQTLNQLKSTYKDNWETFLGNASLKIFFNLEDGFTREYVSKFIGETEVVRQMRSESLSRSESESDTEGSSDSVSESQSESRSRNISRGRSSSVSEGQSRGRSYSSSSSAYGYNSSSGSTSGSNWSRSQSESYSEGSGETFGTTRGTTRGTSRSRTRGTSKSETEGISESLFKTALISPDELGKFFARIDDINNPDYPGLALVLIAGESPVVLRKCNYYEDILFTALYDPHPDHDLPPALMETMPIMSPESVVFDILIDLGPPKISRWLYRVGEEVEKGAPVVEIDFVQVKQRAVKKERAPKIPVIPVPPKQQEPVFVLPKSTATAFPTIKISSPSQFLEKLHPYLPIGILMLLNQYGFMTEKQDQDETQNDKESNVDQDETQTAIAVNQAVSEPVENSPDPEPEPEPEPEPDPEPEEVEETVQTVPIHAPVSGKLTEIIAWDNEQIAPDAALGTLLYSRRRALLERPIEVPDPAGELAGKLAKKELGKAQWLRSKRILYIAIFLAVVISGKLVRFGEGDQSVELIVIILGIVIWGFVIYRAYDYARNYFRRGG